LTQPTWSTPTETIAASSATTGASQRSQQAGTDPTLSAGSATATPPGASAGYAGSAEYTGSATAGSARSAAGKTTATERADHQKDGSFPVVRLLVILVIAALIGCALVLLLK
jgi:cobalamin biosynthesis Mg chelatase CobN